MQHTIDLKRLKYEAKKPITLTSQKGEKIKLNEGDTILLPDGELARSLKYKRLFIEIPLIDKEVKKESKTTIKDLNKGLPNV